MDGLKGEEKNGRQIERNREIERGVEYKTKFRQAHNKTHAMGGGRRSAED